ncbi:MAG: hypothetical protein GC164_04455 [Phycisphaera sp.]|nr:hypothetical protein [Phycisphaera sp.]
MPDIKQPLDQSIFDLIMAHLAMLKQYVPGPVKKAGGAKDQLLERYRKDPLYSIFGLDSIEYVSATLGGGTITSIHRKLGDIYEQSVATIFAQSLNMSATDLTYSAKIQSGATEESRSADVYIQFDRVKLKKQRKVIEAFCGKELAKLSAKPKVTLIGVGMEVRHCYQTGDSKRTQADEAMARHLLVSGILPMMPLFCGQSNPGIVSRYRSVWVIKQAAERYAAIRTLSGYDFYDFLYRNRDDFRAPVIEMLRGLNK